MSLTSLPAGRRPADAGRRERILEAAERAFVRHGFHATTMQHVADELGMSAGNLYRYFPSKEAIVEGLCAVDQAERARAFAELMADNCNILKAISAGLRKHVLMKPPEKARLIVEIWAEAGRNPQVAAITRAINADVRAGLDAAKAGGAASTALKVAVRRAVLPHLCRRHFQANRNRARIRSGRGDDNGGRRPRGEVSPARFRRRKRPRRRATAFTHLRSFSLEWERGF